MKNNSFSLHPQLAADTIAIADLPLCRLLLANDNHYPWTILVPRRDNIREAYELVQQDQWQLLTESNALSLALTQIFSPDKLNIAALGNMVPQLHIHHIARFNSDHAWPAPVWGVVAAAPYLESESSRIKTMLLENIALPKTAL